MADINLPNLGRLKAQLLTSDLSQKNSALFQVINQLIDAVGQGIDQINASIESINNSVSNITQFIVLQQISSDSGGNGVNDNELLIPGPTGPIGPTGLTGAIGPVIFPSDGEDGTEYPPIPGPQGNPGVAGVAGPVGPAIPSDSESVDERLIVNGASEALSGVVLAASVLYSKLKSVGPSLGIGTDNPAAQLDVTGSDVVVRISGAGAANQAVVRFVTGGVNRWDIGVNDNLASTGGTLEFNQGGGTPKMVILNSGNVGIGTTTPSNKLHIVADPGTSWGSGAEQLRLDSEVSGHRAEIHLTDGITSDAFISFLPSATASVRKISIGCGSSEVLSLTIDGNGNVIIPGTVSVPGTIIGMAEINPSIGADQNDWAPTGYATATVITIATTGAVNLNISGLQGGVDGRIVYIRMDIANIRQVTLLHESGLSSASNRFSASTFLNQPGHGCMYIWLARNSRWNRLDGTT